jgi:hypothetical protein
MWHGPSTCSITKGACLRYEGHVYVYRDSASQRQISNKVDERMVVWIALLWPLWRKLPVSRLY